MVSGDKGALLGLPGFIDFVSFQYLLRGIVFT